MSVEATVWRARELVSELDSSTEIGGTPHLVHTEEDPAISFDGTADQLVVHHNPLAGAEAFTLEAIFKPESGGEEEQRFVHVQSDGEGRALLELRATERGWYADVFVHFQNGERFLNDPALLHPFDEWHALALVYTGDRLLQYVNGRLELEDSAPAGSLDDGSVSLGMRINRISPFKGGIRCVRFARRALGPDELLTV